MPKTKDAFAMKNFDEQRILSRPFFEEFREDFHFADTASDTEILSSLTVNHTDNLDILQMKLDALDALIIRAAEYQKHIKRHGERLMKYTRVVVNKIVTDETADIELLRTRHKRAGELSMKYCGCVTDINSVTTHFLGGISVKDVGGLCKKIAEKYKAVDDEIKRLYRKTFADRLKRARQSQGMTQAQLGASLKMSRRAITSYENATREPSIAMLVRFSKTLDKPVGWLLGAE